MPLDYIKRPIDPNKLRPQQVAYYERFLEICEKRPEYYYRYLIVNGNGVYITDLEDSALKMMENAPDGVWGKVGDHLTDEQAKTGALINEYTDLKRQVAELESRVRRLAEIEAALIEAGIDMNRR